MQQQLASQASSVAGSPHSPGLSRLQRSSSSCVQQLLQAPPESVTQQMARMRVHSIKRSVSCAAALQTTADSSMLASCPAPAQPQWPAAANFGAQSRGQQYRDFGAAAAAAIAAAVACCDDLVEAEGGDEEG
jgi:type IV pilus biogenesis protein CpaD/CtpE